MITQSDVGKTIKPLSKDDVSFIHENNFWTRSIKIRNKERFRQCEKVNEEKTCVFLLLIKNGQLSLTWKQRWLLSLMLQSISISSEQEFWILQVDCHTPSESNKLYQPPRIKSYESRWKIAVHVADIFVNKMHLIRLSYLHLFKHKAQTDFTFN